MGARSLRDIASSPSAEFMLVAERRACLTAARPPQLRWFGAPALSALGLALDASGEQLASQHGPPAPLYFLGAHSDERFALAADITELVARNALPQDGLALQDLRSCMASLPPAELAIAGRAVALSQWHQAHRFCPRCGAPTAPAAAGAKRQCTATEAHRLYPRTDPVVIMLVQSPDGGSALLGRSHKIPAGMLTCLSGFVDQVRPGRLARRGSPACCCCGRPGGRALDRATKDPRT
jgi:NAD+ diphosphatase